MGGEDQAVIRRGGYAPLRDYAAVGDGRTVALIARDGPIEWLCLPDLDSPAMFDSVLDAESGGRFVLSPRSPFEASRRYLPGTNVLETTFETSSGVVRVIDAMTIPTAALGPERELVRAVEAVSGSVAMEWELVPRFGFGVKPTRVGRRAGVPVATRGADALALCSWNAGEPETTVGSIRGRFDVAVGERALFALSVSHQEPLVIPCRNDVEARLAGGHPHCVATVVRRSLVSLREASSDVFRSANRACSESTCSDNVMNPRPQTSHQWETGSTELG